MLGFDNPIHIAFLLIVLLLVFGAKRLPEMGRSLGDGMRGFKESLSGEHHELPAAQHQHTPSTPTQTPPTAAPVEDASQGTQAEQPKAPIAA